MIATNPGQGKDNPVIMMPVAVKKLRRSRSSHNEPALRSIDTSIENLPDEELEKIIGLCCLHGCNIDDDFLDALVVELLCRRSGL